MDLLNQTIADIQSLKIQGAQGVAEAGLKAWKAAKDKKNAAKLLLNARPTEPMLKNILVLLNKGVSTGKILKKLKEDIGKYLE